MNEALKFLLKKAAVKLTDQYTMPGRDALSFIIEQSHAEQAALFKYASQMRKHYPGPNVQFSFTV